LRSATISIANDDANENPYDFAIQGNGACASPTITSQPTNQTVSAGSPASFSVTATGAGLSYQWRKNGAAISGATMSSFTIAAVTSGDAGNYDVVVTGTCGTVTSNAATLTITCPTVVTNTSDSGAGSLRQAILCANANAGLETISFNIPGTGPHTIAPLTALPTITDPVLFDGYTQPGASANTLAVGSDAVLKIQLDGVNAANGVGGLALDAGSSGSTIRGLAIYRFAGSSVEYGLLITNSTGNFITGNYLGTNATGAAAGLGNHRGIQVRSNNNTIGGATPQTRNVASGNNQAGIFIDGGDSNQILGNYVGLQPNGDAPLANAQYGVWMTSGAQSNTVGGSAAGSRNVISGNNQFGIRVEGGSTSFNVIIGNYIGTDAAGTQARGNLRGIMMLTTGNRIGGTTAGERNIISGNSLSGIYIDTAASTLVQGNYIGTDVTGTANLGNTDIGIDAGGDALNNTIGGSAAGAGNLIAFNGSQGVRIGGRGNLVSRNSIFSNGALGIDLGSGPLTGVTANDAGDGDTGANNLQNYPVLSSALMGVGVTTVTGSLNSTANTTFTLEFFSNTAADPSGFGEGETFRGATTVTTDGAGNVNFSFNIPVALPAGQFVSATATESSNTSEFAQSVPVTSCASPMITSQPTNQTVCAGSPATFSVTATGTGLSYQWRKGGVAIGGASSSSFTIPSATAGDAGSYDVVITGSCGTITSNAASLTVNATTAITAQPANQSSCLGGSVSFSVAATGSGLTYQWRKGGVAISGATAATYNIASVAAGDAGSYDVVVTGACGTVTSGAATLTINASTNINTQPANQTACVGGSATFTVAASGSGTLTYQWRKGGVAIPGATAASFTINPVAAGDAGSYDVVVSSSCGTVTSSAATLTVNPATAITAQPAGQTICDGSPVTFNVTATGAGLSYQWRKNGAAIGGATASSFSIASASAGDAGSYDVVVTGACGTVTSSAATLTVNPATTISSQPANQTVCAGSSATFSVTAAGSGLSYQWRKNGAAISGATSNSFSIAAAAAGDAGSYDVVVTGSCGTVTSSAATLTVNAATAISAQPTNQTVCESSPATFSVTATGAGLSYQWRKNGSNIAGATSSSYNIAAATSANAGSYDVVITSSCGTLTSQAATLTVNPATMITTQPANQSASAGQSVTFSVTASGASLTYQWRKNGAAISGATASSYTIASVAAGDAGNYDVVVTGSCGAVTSSVAALTISSGCATPVVSITGPASGSIYAVGTPVNFTGAFTDASGGTHSATWSFDTITYPGVVNEAAGTVSASYSFTQAGVYQVRLTVSNSCGQQGSATTIGELSAMVVVYDPDGGFVTGGGWINSPVGAYVPDPSLTGKANFGFVSKYKKGNNVPEGQTEFNFNVANFKFHSTVYEWLVVSGARAQYKGSGQVNNAGDYRFILTAIDGQRQGGGGQDKFRIKIWNNQGGGLVYDNQMNAPDSADPTTVLGGGQIVIHTGGNGNSLAAQAAQAANGAGQTNEAEVEWQIIVGGEGETQSVLSGGSAAPYFDVIAPGDYDGDGQTDLAIFRRANGHWLIKRSSDGGLIQLQWGLGSDLPVAADYDGDGKTDIAVWRGATGQWFILRSSDGAKRVMVWGTSHAPYHDLPAPADYDGDGKADVAVWRAAEGKWHALGSASNSVITGTGEAPRR
jgi:hypothetical protein